MSEKEVYKELISWVKKYPELFKGYLFAYDKKKMARRLLKFKLEKEPSHVYDLPAGLLKKLGIKAIENPKVKEHLLLELAKLLKGNISMIIKIR